MKKDKFEVTYIQKGQEKTIGYMGFELWKKRKLIDVNPKGSAYLFESLHYDVNDIREDVSFLHIKNAYFYEDTLFRCYRRDTILCLENCMVEKGKLIRFVNGNVILDSPKAKNISRFEFNNNDSVDLIMKKELESSVFCTFDGVENLTIEGNAKNLYFPMSINVLNLLVKNVSNLRLNQKVFVMRNLNIEDSKISATSFDDYQDCYIKDSIVTGDITNFLQFSNPIHIENSKLIAQGIRFPFCFYQKSNGERVEIGEDEIRSIDVKARMISVLKGIEKKADILLEEEVQDTMKPFQVIRDERIQYLYQQIREEGKKYFEQQDKTYEKGKKQKIKSLIGKRK